MDTETKRGPVAQTVASVDSRVEEAMSGIDLTGPATPGIVNAMKQRAEAMLPLWREAISRTRPGQWQIYGDRAYMTGNAAEALAAALGLAIRGTGPNGEPQFEFRELAGGAWQFECLIQVSGNHRDVWDIGESNSFDDFLAPFLAKLQERGATPEVANELARDYGKKCAYSNGVGRAVTAWTGLGGLTLAELESLGLPSKEIGRVEFKKGSKGGAVTTVTVAELKTLPKGSKANVRGVCSGGAQSSSKSGKPYTKVSMVGGVVVTIFQPKPEWLASGTEVYFEAVDVGEYQGKPSYTAKAVAAVDGGSDSPPVQQPDGPEPGAEDVY